MLSELLQLTRPLTIFDLETTGIDPVGTRACSLAMRVHRPGSNEVQPYRTLINPLVHIPKEASDVHGITDEIIATGCARCWAPKESHPNGDCVEWKPIPTWKQLSERLLGGFQSCDFCGYNIRFDLKVSATEFERCNMTFDYSTASVIDSFRVWQILEPRTLSDAVEHFLGRKMTGAHNAAIDVDHTEEVLIHQLTKHARCTVLPRTVKELGDLLFPRDPSWIDSEGKFVWINNVPCLNFGKHKGRPMKDCKDYLAWMYGAAFTAEVKKICDEALAGRFPKRPLQFPQRDV